MLVAMTFYAAPAHAQATRTWVSGVGDDANPCSRTAPCKTFAGAISKPAVGGEINCLDPGGFGAVTITKSITIDCTGTNGSILAANFTGVIINAGGGVVTLRNLQINGASTTTGVGIRILAAAAVNVDHVVIENFGGTGINGRGITIETSTAGTQVNVQNCRIYNINNVGILSIPTASVVLAIDHTTVARGAASGIQLTQNTSASIDNTSVTHFPAGAGLVVELATATANVTNSLLANNGTGVYSGNAGGTPTTRLYGTVITGNTATGLQINSGTIISLGNNMIRGNAGNEVPSSTITTQ